MRINEFARNLSLAEQKMVAYIKQNCGQILELYHTIPERMYRNAKMGNVGFFITNSPENRTPVDTPPNLQHDVDYALHEAGFRALRSNSIFVLGVPPLYKFGEQYIIFPEDNFEFTWSIEFMDFANIFYDFNLQPGKNINYEEIMYDEDLEPTFGEFLNDLLNLTPVEFAQAYKFRDDNLEEALASRCEIYVHGRHVGVAVNQERILKALGLIS